MKKVILALIAVGSFVTAEAQTQAPKPGSILAYGNLGFSSRTDTAQNKFIDWNASPGIGYQFNDNMTVGLNLGWGMESGKPFAATSAIVKNNYNAGAFFRYTHPFSNIFFAFAQLDAGYQGTYTTFAGVPAYNKANGIYGNITPALGIHVGKSVALNFAIGNIGYSTWTYDGVVNSESRFNVTLGQQFNIGISKNFCGRSVKSERKPMDEIRNLIINDDDE